MDKKNDIVLPENSKKRKKEIIHFYSGESGRSFIKKIELFFDEIKKSKDNDDFFNDDVFFIEKIKEFSAMNPEFEFEVITHVDGKELNNIFSTNKVLNGAIEVVTEFYDEKEQ